MIERRLELRIWVMVGIWILSLALLAFVSGCEEPFVPPPCPQPSTISGSLLAAHNAARERVGVGPLVEDPELTRGSQSHADWMAATNHFQHAFGVNENIAYNYTNMDEVMEIWMKSPGHRRNILDPRWTRFGGGWHQAANGVQFWCTRFK
ncbi:MAG: CAP domain-containing protein [Isosphaeraceae bacterium]|nr:CAP domain-containing protein [Isosphaeraceae bacterium]